MANDKLNKELVSRMMDDAAWKELSKDFPWTEQLLEKYMWTGKKFQETTMQCGPKAYLKNSSTDLTGTN